MSDDNGISRVNKYEKRRKNTKFLSLSIILGVVLFIVLLGILIFGGGNGEEQAEDNQPESSADGSLQNEGKDENDRDSEMDGQSESDNDDQEDNNSDNTTGQTGDDTSDPESDSGTEEDIQTEQAEPSGDNVMEAYTGNWQPVGTEQSEPHSINYDEGSQDRLEMRKAVATATGLNEDTFRMWWVERNGDQKVINTVSNQDESEVYRVYLTWVTNEGWQPTKVERLIENDWEERSE